MPLFQKNAGGYSAKLAGRVGLVFTTLLIVNGYSYASSAGKTILVKGQVLATNAAEANTRTLKRRSEIFAVDQIQTGANSKAQFSMADGGLLTLKENSEIKIRDYQFSSEAQGGSATIDVISGGLRSISGLIKKNGGDYQVTTPVGSIGIRGTHFAIDVVGDKVYFAVFNGNIDLTLNNQQTFSLGVNESFSFASVDELGQITPMTQAPAITSAGYGSASDESQSEEGDDADSAEPASSANSSLVATNINEVNNNQATTETGQVNVAVDPAFYTESTWQGTSSVPVAELIAKRTGQLNYQVLASSNISSSVGGATGLQMSMTVDFDHGSVPGGSLSFTDNQGQWFATYSGLINVDRLDLGITFAAHADRRASGSIVAGFTNGLDEIFGQFDLFELNNPSISAKGKFQLTP